MHENKIFFCCFLYFYFAIFQRKSSILIPHLYLYSIKIQTNIKQNSVTKYTGKSQIFPKIFFLKIFGTRPNPTRLCELGLYWPSYKARLSPAAWAGLMFQPNKQTAVCQLNVIR